MARELRHDIWCQAECVIGNEEEDNIVEIYALGISLVFKDDDSPEPVRALTERKLSKGRS